MVPSAIAPLLSEVPSLILKLVPTLVDLALLLCSSAIIMMANVLVALMPIVTNLPFILPDDSMVMSHILPGLRHRARRQQKSSQRCHR
jgi:hypothetical protein